MILFHEQSWYSFISLKLLLYYVYVAYTYAVLLKSFI